MARALPATFSRPIAVLALSIGILLSLACGTEAAEKITIAEAFQAVFSLIYIADDQGFFADEGLEVTFNSFTSGKDALNSVINGESDIATVYCWQPAKVGHIC